MIGVMAVTSWARSYPRFHMALWCAIAVLWLMLGANSGRVPWGTSSTWLLVNSFVSGAALGVAYRRTANSMLVYLIAALIAGACRSIAYLSNGSTGPGWVWLIITLTNVVLLGQWGTKHQGGT
jgi:hypothetical protein